MQVSSGAATVLQQVEDTGRSMAEVMSTLQGVATHVEGLQRSAEESSGRIAEMARAHDEVAKRVEEMAASVAETTASIEEMTHAEKLIERILYLDGTPSMSDYFKINVGATVEQQFKKAGFRVTTDLRSAKINGKVRDKVVVPVGVDVEGEVDEVLGAPEERSGTTVRRQQGGAAVASGPREGDARPRSRAPAPAAGSPPPR